MFWKSKHIIGLKFSVKPNSLPYLTDKDGQSDLMSLFWGGRGVSNFLTGLPNDFLNRPSVLYSHGWIGNENCVSPIAQLTGIDSWWTGYCFDWWLVEGYAFFARLIGTKKCSGQRGLCFSFWVKVCLSAKRISATGDVSFCQALLLRVCAEDGLVYRKLWWSNVNQIYCLPKMMVVL